jgi:hypothetical protein
MSTDGGSLLETTWDSLAAMVFSVYDGYGWIVPAVLLSALFLLLFFWLAALMDGWSVDLPLDEVVFRGPCGIFRWMRDSWREGREKPESRGEPLGLNLRL